MTIPTHTPDGRPIFVKATRDNDRTRIALHDVLDLEDQDGLPFLCRVAWKHVSGPEWMTSCRGRDSLSSDTAGAEYINGYGETTDHEDEATVDVADAITWLMAEGADE